MRFVRVCGTSSSGARSRSGSTHVGTSDRVLHDLFHVMAGADADGLERALDRRGPCATEAGTDHAHTIRIDIDGASYRQHVPKDRDPGRTSSP